MWGFIIFFKIEYIFGVLQAGKNPLEDAPMDFLEIVLIIH